MPTVANTGKEAHEFYIYDTPSTNLFLKYWGGQNICGWSKNCWPQIV